MTCIVGIEKDGKVYIGGDSASVDGGNLNVDIVTTPKIFIRDEYIMGYTTSWRMGQILNFCGSLPTPPAESETVNDLDKFMVTTFIPKVQKIFEQENFIPQHSDVKHGGGSFLVGTRGRLYTVHGDWQCIHQSRGWDAVGCGGSFALGSLYATRSCQHWEISIRINEALACAAYYSGGVKPPFIVRSL